MIELRSLSYSLRLELSSSLYLNFSRLELSIDSSFNIRFCLMNSVIFYCCKNKVLRIIGDIRNYSLFLDKF